MSKVIKAIIVDDEKRARDLLTTLIKDTDNNVEVVGTADSAKSGITLIENLRPDLVFLDIEMPQENGFQLLRRFDNINFKVIFTTAFNEYAIEAIKVSALDYLLKPVDREELAQAINKFRLENQNFENSEPKKSFLLPEHINQLVNQDSKIALPIAKGLKVVKLKDIVYCKADGAYTNFHFNHGRQLLVSNSLKFFEKKLSTFGIIRTHDSYLVNLEYVDTYIRGRGGQLQLKDGNVVEVSRTRKKEVLEKLTIF